MVTMKSSVSAQSQVTFMLARCCATMSPQKMAAWQLLSL